MGKDMGLVSRPRWGVGSVRTHLDVDDLALALVLFDRVVLPTPSDAEEEERWRDNGWDPQRLTHLAVRLDPLLHFVLWDGDLRRRWDREMGYAQQAAAEVEGLGYYMTGKIISASAWKAATDDLERGGAAAAPVPFSWCPRTTDELARRGININTRDTIEEPPIEVFAPDFDGTDPLDEPTEALVFSHTVTVPTSTDTDAPDDVLDRTYKLATDTEFVTARSTMYARVAAMAAGAIPEDEIVDQLGQAAADYDQQMARYKKAEVQRIAHTVAPTVVGVAPKAFGLHLPGASWAVKKLMARFNPLPPPPTADHPGGALANAGRLLPRVHTDNAALARAAARAAVYEGGRTRRGHD
jgi:hypothetical protein